MSIQSNPNIKKVTGSLPCFALLSRACRRCMSPDNIVGVFSIQIICLYHDQIPLYDLLSTVNYVFLN